MSEFSSDFVRRIVNLHGSDGKKWLDELPSKIQFLEQKWNIKVSAPTESLNYNYIAPAQTRGGIKAVLKIGISDIALEREAEFLTLSDGNGTVRLLQYSPEQNAILLERILPGYSIKQLDELHAIKAFVSVIKKLKPFTEVNFDFPSVQNLSDSFKELREQFNGGSGPLPSELVDEGERTFKALAGSMSSTTLLHGDLHHENILSGSRSPWMAIDPKGVTGEPEYEIGVFLRNPTLTLVSKDNLVDIIKTRINIISEMTGYDKERIAKWGFAQAVLSAIWSYEDHRSGWNDVLKIARAIQKCFA